MNRSQEQRDWILNKKFYNVRFNEGRAGAVYKSTQQVFTASFLMLYDYNNPFGGVECYSLSGETFLADSGMMKGLAYPKQDWMGVEEYLVYGVGERVADNVCVKDVLDKHPEVEDGRPLYLYFVEVESFIHE